MNNIFNSYDVQPRALASRYGGRMLSRRYGGSGSNCSLKTSDCGADLCLSNCQCVPQSECNDAAVIGGVMAGVIVLLIILLVYLQKSGKLRRCKSRVRGWKPRAVSWAKSFGKPKKYATPAQPVQEKQETPYSGNAEPEYNTNITPVKDGIHEETNEPGIYTVMQQQQPAYVDQPNNMVYTTDIPIPQQGQYGFQSHSDFQQVNNTPNTMMYTTGIPIPQQGQYGVQSHSDFQQVNNRPNIMMYTTGIPIPQQGQYGFQNHSNFQQANNNIMTYQNHAIGQPLSGYGNFPTQPMAQESRYAEE